MPHEVTDVIIDDRELLQGEQSPGSAENRIAPKIAIARPGTVSLLLRHEYTGEVLCRRSWRLLVEPVVVAVAVAIRVQQDDAAVLQAPHEAVHRLVVGRDGRRRAGVVAPTYKCKIRACNRGPILPMALDVVQGILEPPCAGGVAVEGHLEDQVARLQLVDPGQPVGTGGVIPRATVIGVAVNGILDVADPHVQLSPHPGGNSAAEVFSIDQAQHCIAGVGVVCFVLCVVEGSIAPATLARARIGLGESQPVHGVLGNLLEGVGAPVDIEIQAAVVGPVRRAAGGKRHQADPCGVGVMGGTEVDPIPISIGVWVVNDTTAWQCRVVLGRQW